MPKARGDSDDYDSEDGEGQEHDELETAVAPMSTAVEVGSSSKQNGYHQNGLNRRESNMSKEISLHFQDMKEYELERQRHPRVEECPISANDAPQKDPYWTPTYDGSVRPRMELSYVKPQEYNGMIKEIQPQQPRQEAEVPARLQHIPPPFQPMPSAFEPSPPPSPPPEKKKKKKKKKKKRVKIVEDVDISGAE